MCAVALARDGLPRRVAGRDRRRPRGRVAGWAQTRPPSAGRWRRWSTTSREPAAHQTCEQRGAVRYCAYPSSRHLVDAWQARVGACWRSCRRRGGTTPRGHPTDPDDDRQLGLRAPTLPRRSPRRGRRPAEPAAVWPDDGQLHPDLGNGSFPCRDRDSTSCSPPCRPVRGPSACHRRRTTTTSAAGQRPGPGCARPVARRRRQPDGAELLRTWRRKGRRRGA